MSTTNQIEANRANAQLSTGPKTPEGISNTRFNATKHGLTGNQIVIKGEDPAAYDALRAQLTAEHAPASETEAMLVEEIAQNFWRLERARRCEAELLSAMDLVTALSDKVFTNLQRYTTRIERNFARARKDLASLQAFRRKLVAQQQAHAAAVSFVQSLADSPRPAIGSVLSRPVKPSAAPPPPDVKKVA